MAVPPIPNLSLSATPVSSAGGDDEATVNSIFDFGDKNSGGGSGGGVSDDFERTINNLIEKVVIGIAVGLAVKFLWGQIK